jgi:uncharacterized membrane protein
VSERTSSGVDATLASVLAYACWWLTGLVFLFAERRHAGVRFHAAQSTVLFGSVTLLLLGLGAASAASLLIWPAAYGALQLASSLIWLGSAALWLLLLVRTARGEIWKVPVAAALAERLAGPA